MDRVAYGTSFTDGAGKRFLTVDVKARSGRCYSWDGVPLVRHCQLYCIEVASTNQLAKIKIGCTITVAISLVNCFLGSVSMCLINIANGHHLHFRLA
jgi:hypothetical protein